MKITRGGQISIPSEVRRRWGGESVILRDEGERVVLTPATADAVDVAAGALREYFRELDLAELRRTERQAEALADERKLGSVGPS